MYGKKIGLGVLFLVAVGLYASYGVNLFSSTGIVVVAAAVIGGYMALNIGANDVANNIGAAVGSRALTMAGAVVIAIIFEASGALIAGGDVVNTISKGIIDASLFPDARTFILAMMAALLAAALWLNLATYIGAPVSTTHSIVGGVMGGGVAAIGFDAVNWVTMSKIAASWVVSPVMGALIAAAFLGLIKIYIYAKDDKLAAARRWVPILVGVMATAFSVYLVMKGLKKIWQPDMSLILLFGAAMFGSTYFLLRAWVARRIPTLENSRYGVHKLFIMPLICSAALLSFAHGANDVANAVGPLAAIISTIGSNNIAAQVEVPIWVMVIGALGIAVGLAVYGPKLVRVVGEQITKLTPVRAFCVALAAAITVIIASTLGLPVSSTHIAVGGVFGVGFLRETITNWQRDRRRLPSTDSTGTPIDMMEGPYNRRRKLVRRRPLLTILTAWVVTVPLAALLAAFLFRLLNAYVVL